METASITVNLTPLQQLLSIAFQVWMIIFPIILIRKINYLTSLLQDQFDPKNDDQNES